VAAWLAQLPPDEAWQWRAPPVLMPVPAAEISLLRGERVVMFDADHGGWVYDQFAVTEPHQRDGETVVGLLDAADWYRSKREPDHVVVPRSHPLTELWVEVPQDVGNVSPVPPDQSDMLPSVRTKSLIVDLTHPPVRWLRIGLLQDRLNGSRCWLLTPKGPSRGWRVCGEPRRAEYRNTINLAEGLDGLNKPVIGTVTPVCAESAWYRWRQTGETPRLRLEATRFVWLE
jgi:hypothetical protein